MNSTGDSMKVSCSRLGGAALAAFALAGCANFPPQTLSWRMPPQLVTGTVFYRYVEPLPENAVVEVKLVETPGPGQPETLVSEQTITSFCNFIDPPCNGPVFYELPYDPAQVDATREYRVSVRILDGEKTIYASDTPNRVLTGGFPRNTQILVAKQP
jgi:putative lipoprotein